MFRVFYRFLHGFIDIRGNKKTARLNERAGTTIKKIAGRAYALSATLLIIPNTPPGKKNIKVFELLKIGGGEENRTPVRKSFA